MSESDPTFGVDLSAPGAKGDFGKSPVTKGAFKYFPRAMKAVGLVSKDGADKYSWNGWESVENGIERYSDALGRHITDEGIDGLYDPKSKTLHAGHRAWNALAELELLLREVPLYQPEEH